MTALTARAVTAALKRAGFGLFRSQIVVEGMVKVTQEYTARGAFAAADTRARREARARLAAGVLAQEGWHVVQIDDRLTITKGETP